MYRLYVTSSDDTKYGISPLAKEFYLNSAEDVCNVIKSLSPCRMVYTLAEVNVSSVDDVLEHFLLKEA